MQCEWLNNKNKCKQISLHTRDKLNRLCKTERAKTTVMPLLQFAQFLIFQQHTSVFSELFLSVNQAVWVWEYAH